LERSAREGIGEINRKRSRRDHLGKGWERSAREEIWRDQPGKEKE
jgi:hypothetical protein